MAPLTHCASLSSLSHTLSAKPTSFFSPNLEYDNKQSLFSQFSRLPLHSQSLSCSSHTLPHSHSTKSEALPSLISMCSLQPADGVTGDAHSIPISNRTKPCHVAVPATSAHDRTDKIKPHGSTSDHGSLTSRDFMSSSVATSFPSAESARSDAYIASSCPLPSSVAPPFSSSNTFYASQAMLMPEITSTKFPPQNDYFSTDKWMAKRKISFSHSPNKGQNVLEKGSSIAVIGAGVSGIVATKILAAKGYNVTVFEAQNSLGGIWGRTYPSTSLQTPRTAYRYSDWSWPDSAPMNPSHVEVVEYLEGYVSHFGIRDLIQFNTKVTDMKEAGGRTRGWNLRVQRSNAGESASDQWQQFDYVVMCCGCFSGQPNMPQFPHGKGPEVFHGKVMHSSEYSGLKSSECVDLFRGKKVVVVGFQKTAIDVTLEAAEANRDSECPPPTLLFRKTHWLVPRNQEVMGVQLKHLLLTRFMELFTPQPDLHPLQKLMQTILPLRQITNSVVEAYLKWKYPLEKYNLLPSHSFMDDVSACILPQLPPSFFSLVENKRLSLVKSATWHFSPEGISLADGTVVDADVVLLCTGYDSLSKLKSLLPPFYGSKLSNNGKSIYLYRGVLHPEIPSMAFLGFHEGLSSMHSAEMGARWLSKLLGGSFSLPTKTVMAEETNKWFDFKKTQTRFADRVSCVAPIHSWHFDSLCKDMGWEPMRKKGLIANWFTPYGSVDYAEPVEERERSEEEKESESGVLATNLNGLDLAKVDFNEVMETN